MRYETKDGELSTENAILEWTVIFVKKSKKNLSIKLILPPFA